MYGKKNGELIEIFRTQNGVVYQCNKKNQICLEYSGISSFFKIAHFLDLTKKVNQIDLLKMAHSSSRHSDIVILMPHYTERCFVLTLTDTLNFRELLNGAKFMLQLNSVVSQCLSTQVQ